MKALTLTQPWATLVAIGAKRYETRSWRTHHVGPVAIHAAKGGARYDLLYAEPFRQALFGNVWPTPGDARRSLPLGAIVAVAELADVYSTDELGLEVIADADADGGREAAFGDWGPCRFVWKLTNVRALPQPIPCRGALGLWDVPADLLPLIESRPRAGEAASTSQGVRSSVA